MPDATPVRGWIGKPCPQCGYVRKPIESGPGSRCPNCRVPYAELQPRPRTGLLRYLLDPSVLSLVAANALVLFIAYRLRMNPLSLVLIYCMQTVMICMSQIVRILKLQRFDGDAHFSVPKDAAGFVAGFYGLIHLIYVFVLVATAAQERIKLGAPAAYALCALAFAISQIIALIRGMASDAAGRPSLFVLVFLPGPRVLAMHVTLVFGLFMVSGALGVLLVGALKTVADVAMYVIEQELLAPRPQQDD
jgi:hypothetical protein